MPLLFLYKYISVCYNFCFLSAHNRAKKIHVILITFLPVSRSRLDTFAHLKKVFIDSSKTNFMEVNTNGFDLRCIELLKSGDQKGLDGLFEKYYQPLCEFAELFLDNEYHSEEVVSDLFLELWVKRGALSIESNIKGYLFISTKNKSLNFLKKHNKHIVSSLDSELSVASKNDADSLLDYEELSLAVNNMLKSMPPQRRLIFTMNRLEGFKYQEIADALSISVHTVHNQLTKANKYVTEKAPELLPGIISLSLAFVYFPLPL